VQNARRNLFKDLTVEDANCKEVPWNCGDDCPVSWDEEDLKKMAFKTVKHNYKIGAITKEVYLSLMGSVRNGIYGISIDHACWDKKLQNDWDTK